MRPALFAACVAVFAIACACAARAGSFTANPIRVVVPAGATAASVTLTNTGDETVLVQAEVLAWSHPEGADLLTPTEELVVSPPIFRIAAGASQIVRVGLAGGAPADREIPYRLFLQEVPQPLPAGGPGVSVALRLGLPVFVTPRVRAAPRLAWRVQPEGEGIRLTVTNSGNAHSQLVDCRVTRGDGALVAAQALGAYVLPGGTRSWLVKPSQPWRGEPLRVSAQTAAGTISADIAAP